MKQPADNLLSAIVAVAHLTIGLLSLATRVAAGAPVPSAPDLAFFESKVRPLLVKRCHECHSRESGRSKGGLLLDSRAGWRKGGENGPAIVPGDPARSLLIKAVRYADADFEMPPKEKLPDHEIAILTQECA